MIFTTLSRRLLQWNKQSNVTVTITNNKKNKKLKKSKKESASSCCEQSPSALTTKVTTTIIDEASDRTTSDNAENMIATTNTTEEHIIAPDVETKKMDESVPDVITLPPPISSVSLRPEEMKFHCQVRIKAQDVKYSMVTKVLKSWENDLKVIPKWETIGGELLLRKMFELEPDCIRMFGFPLDTKHDDPALSTNEKFIKKGIALIVAVDIALTFLGPDLEPLEEQLLELGGRHVARQCKPRHWPMVGVALFYTLEMALGNKFTKEIQDCWIILYNFLGYHMIQGLIKNGGPTWDDDKDRAVTKIETTTLVTTVENIDPKETNDTINDSVPDVITLPPPITCVKLRPDEMKFHCQVRIMAQDVKYSMVTKVLNSWEKDLKIIPKWETIGGELLLRKMFELEPDCIRMFGFPLDTKHDDPALSSNEKFIKKGIALIVAVDIALTFLGPDLEPLEEQLIELGGRHVARQCKPRHWPMVGVALFYTLEMALGNKFTKEIQDCWIVLYNFLGYHMIQGLIKNGGPTWEE